MINNALSGVVVVIASGSLREVKCKDSGWPDGRPSDYEKHALKNGHRLGSMTANECNGGREPVLADQRVVAVENINLGSI